MKLRPKEFFQRIIRHWILLIITVSNTEDLLMILFKMCILRKAFIPQKKKPCYARKRDESVKRKSSRMKASEQNSIKTKPVKVVTDNRITTICKYWKVRWKNRKSLLTMKNPNKFFQLLAQQLSGNCYTHPRHPYKYSHVLLGKKSYKIFSIKFFKLSLPEKDESARST